MCILAKLTIPALSIASLGREVLSQTEKPLGALKTLNRVSKMQLGLLSIMQLVVGCELRTMCQCTQCMDVSLRFVNVSISVRVPRECHQITLVGGIYAQKRNRPPRPQARKLAHADAG